MARLIFFCVLSVIFALPVIAEEFNLKGMRMKNKIIISDQIIAGGPPLLSDLQNAKEQGVTTVIDLRDPEERGMIIHQQTVEQLDLNYINIPVTPKTLTRAQADQVAAILENAQPEDKFILHCASGNRVGAVWALYEYFHLGKNKEEAITAGLKNGLRSPKLQEITTELMQTK